MHALNDLVPRRFRSEIGLPSGLVLLGALLVGLGGCGGVSNNRSGEAVATIDTSALLSDDAIADAAAAEHGAPGENEHPRLVLTGNRATDDAINALRLRGFEDVEAAAR
jgi:hypothetical protein